MRKLFLVPMLLLFVVIQLHGQCPSANFTSTAPACSSSNISFTNTSGNTGGGWTYFWDFDYPNGGGASPATSTTQNPTVNYSPGGNGVYSVAFTIMNTASGCTSTVVIDIDIRTARADFITSAATVCVGDSIQIGNTGTGPGSSFATVTHQWTFGNDAIPSVWNQPYPPSVVYTTPGPKTITHLVTANYSACGSGTRTDLFTQNILVNPTPVPAFTSDAPACAGSSVNFTYSGSGASAYSWDLGAGASPSTSTSMNPSSVQYGIAGTTTITLTATNNFGCAASTTQTIQIDGLPLAYAGPDTTICANTSVQIGGNPSAGLTYTWFPSSQVNNASIANPVASPIAAQTSFILGVTDNTTGCSANDTIEVAMLPPLTALAGADREICYGDSIEIGAALIDGQQYSWTPAIALSSATDPSPMAAPGTTSTYTLSVTGSGCGPVTDEITIVVHPLPDANAGADDSITIGSSTQLIATGGLQYEWLPVNGLDNSGIYNPVASPDSTTTYVVTVTDIYGCVNDDSVTITVIAPSVWIPTAFTPNNDGRNDVLYVRGEGVSGFQFAVFNKWGEQVYYSSAMENGWDGKKVLTGEDMPQGAYVYIIKGTLSTGEVLDVKGMVNLIR